MGLSVVVLILVVAVWRLWRGRKSAGQLGIKRGENLIETKDLVCVEGHFNEEGDTF